MENKTLQIQAVLYHNEVAALEKTLSNMANALEVSKRKKGVFTNAKFVYGDASSSPIFSEEQIAQYNKKYQGVLEIQYMYFGFNSGTSKGHNIMAKNCETDYLIIMNPDIIVCPQFFLEVAKPFEDALVGIVESRQTPLEHQKEYDIKTGETAWASMACSMIRTEIYKKINGFDEKTFFMYCDDVDISWRTRLQGYKIIYQPTALVYHSKKLSVSGEWMPTSAETYYSAEAALFMAHKYSNPKRVEKLLKIFLAQNGPEKKAAEEFLSRKKEGTLPEVLDKEHKVATFVGDYYSENRFVL